MEPTLAPPDVANLLELRVLDGAQSGARAQLQVGEGCVIAAQPHADGADIVLRESHSAPARVRVIADMPLGVIEVLEGEVHLGGQVLVAGARAMWAAREPLKIGGSVVAFGPERDEDWSQASPPNGQSGDAPEAEDTRPALAAPTRRRAEFWLATVGAGIALASAGALVLAHVVASPRAEAHVPDSSLPVALRASEFAALEAARDAEGRVELHGRLGTLAQRKRLDAWLAARQFSPMVNVQVDESIARDVTDVFRVNGVAVETHPAGPGRIVAEASERDPDRLSRAEEVVRRDVRGLDRLTVINKATPAPAPAPPVIDDPGKRIASLVPGDPAFIVTADGARYFIGSMLPTGHRITQIVEQRVTLERDGQSTNLNF